MSSLTVDQCLGLQNGLNVLFLQKIIEKKEGVNRDWDKIYEDKELIRKIASREITELTNEYLIETPTP